ncbi:hypothetical protein DMX03_06905 [Pseudomonas koreensis]|nr:hypothetical protein DMX03_06905 [Pseudomonas koreensis]
MPSKPHRQTLWERACSRKRRVSQPCSQLPECLREQARSHTCSTVAPCPNPIQVLHLVQVRQ